MRVGHRDIAVAARELEGPPRGVSRWLREVLQRPDAVQVPSIVLDFLCGPWAQVVAHARMTDRSGADDCGGDFVRRCMI